MIKMGAKDRISYTYRSDGVKMREQSTHQYTKLVMKVSASGDTTYVQRNASDTHYRAHYGSYVKETGQPDKIYNEEGYIALHGDSVSYHFFERDYLGSVRAVFDLHGNLEQTNDYNATGVPSSRHLGNADVHKHTGKEFQGFNGLAWYDNQARYYDPILARFTTQDPLAETTPWNSPYAHCSNNPLNRIDPLGLVDYFLLNGKHYKTIDDGNNTKQLILTRSKDNADEYIENNLYITVPTDKIVQQMKNVYNLTEKTGHEYGFVVGENGMYSTVIAGSTTEIGSGWSDAKSEIASKGDIVAYDVHSHPNLRSSTEAYNSALSSIEDRESISGNQPCIILGYNYKLYIPINQIAGSPQISYHQSIGFYNKETDILSLDFSDFCRIVKKINRYDNKK